jgi:hypothetical protein
MVPLNTSAKAGGIQHRLARAFAEVDDRQAAMAQRDRSIQMQTFAIRPAPRQFGDHGASLARSAPRRRNEIHPRCRT